MKSIVPPVPAERDGIKVRVHGKNAWERLSAEHRDCAAVPALQGVRVSWRRSNGEKVRGRTAIGT